METRLIRYPEVGRLTGLSRTSVWRQEKAGKFPRRRRLGPNSVAWLLSEVQEYLRTREVVIVGGDKNAEVGTTPADE